MKNISPWYHLIETYTGVSITRALQPKAFRMEISEKVDDLDTIHDQIQGWFAPAITLFNKKNDA